MSAPPRLLLGTANRGKVAELVELLAPAGVLIVSLADVGGAPEVDESGATPAENAALKATAYARQFGLWTLADDTTLSVAALGGAPGIHTARFAGPRATAAENQQLLLARLAGVPEGQRGACFACDLCLADPTGAVRATSAGRCQGRIRAALAGGGGFGYDPLFEVLEYHRTFAELGSPSKGIFSHRARAVEAILPAIARLVRPE